MNIQDIFDLLNTGNDKALAALVAAIARRGDDEQRQEVQMA